MSDAITYYQDLTLNEINPFLKYKYYFQSNQHKTDIHGECVIGLAIKIFNTLE